MHRSNQVYKALLVVLLSVPVNVYAAAWSCSSANKVREINIESPATAPLPCSVVYRKADEGFIEPQVLWSAQHDETYCERKAKGLVEKLELAGWVCSKTINPSTQ